MKRMKKGLSLLLCAIMVLGTVAVGFGGIASLKADAATNADGKLTVNSSGSFTILQVTDLHDFIGFDDNKIMAVKKAINSSNPDLIVMTGDNITATNQRTDMGKNNGNSEKLFKASFKEFVNEFHDIDGNKIPFAVTFGNHDVEAAPGNYKSFQALYELSLECGAIDYDNPLIDDWGTGCIPIYNVAGTQIVDKVILINSGDNITEKNSMYGKAGYTHYTQDVSADEAVYQQIVSYVNAEIDSDPNAKVIAFQHIPLQEMYLADGILESTSSGGKGCQLTSNSSISGNYTAASSTTGSYNETCCCSYNSTKDLYLALAKSNTLGIFYGHDHSNTIYGKGTCYGKELVQGYGGGLQGSNKLSAYTISSTGSLSKTVYDKDTSAEITKAGSDYPQGNGELYIKDIRVFSGGSDDSSAITACNAADYTPIVYFVNTNAYSVSENNEIIADLNEGTKGDSTVLGYITTDNPAEAIRDIRSTEGKAAQNSITVNGSTYDVVKSNGGTSAGNCNVGIDSTTTPIYLYVSKDCNAGDPITAIALLMGTAKDKDNAINSIDYIEDYSPYKLASNFDSSYSDSGDYITDLNAIVNGCKIHIAFQQARVNKYYGATMTAPYPKISVPDTIYLTPNSSTSTSFQYYCNNNANGTAKSGYDSTGEFYFSLGGATLNSITADNASITISTSKYTNGTAINFTGSLSSGIAPSMTTTITWTFNYSLNGKTYNAKAYTVAYAPQFRSVGAISEGYSSSGNRNGISTWISGVQRKDGIASFGVNAYGDSSSNNAGKSDISGYFIKEPLLNLNSVPKGTPNKSDELITSDSNNIWAYGTHLNGSNRSYDKSALGVIVYDYSRQKNSNQIPNLYFGSDLNNADCANDSSNAKSVHLYSWFKYSTSSTITGMSYDDGYDNNMTKIMSIPKDGMSFNNSTVTKIRCTNGTQDTFPTDVTNGLKMFCDANSGRAYRFYFKINQQLNDTGISYIHYATQGRSYKGYSQAFASVRFEAVDKSDLRKYVFKLNGLAEGMASDVSNTNFNKWSLIQDTLKESASVLGKPTASQSEVDTAVTKIKNIIYESNRPKIAIDAYFNGNGGTVPDNYTWDYFGSASTAALFYSTVAQKKIGSDYKPNSRDGYTFLGWSRSPESIVATNQPGESNARFEQGATYYAVWEKNPVSYTISYNLNDGFMPDGAENPTSYKSGLLCQPSGGTGGFALVNPVRENYVFLGWTGSNGSTPQKYISIPKGTTGNLTYTANWAKDIKELKIDSNGGQYNGNIVYFENGEATASDTFWGQGGTLTAANNGESGISISAANIATTGNGGSNQKILAYLEYGKSYTLSYTCNLDSSKVYFYILGTENKFTKPGSATEFSSSLIIKNSQGTHIIDNGDGTYTRTMNFTVGESDGTTETNWDRMQTPSDATMVYFLRLDYNNTGVNNFEINNLKIVPTSDATVKIKAITDSEIAFNDPTRDGYSFTGWIINPSNNGTAYSANGITVGTSDTTLTANWEIVEVPITYNLDGGENDSRNPESYSAETNMPITFYNPEKEGYSFAGWTAEENVTIINDTAEYRKSGAGDFLKYSIPGPFAEGDVYVMECDVKGNGQFDNYFYGDTGYLNIAYSDSESEIPEAYRDTHRNANGDGSNHILNDTNCTTDGEYKHYMVTFTLGGTGDGTVTKYLMFRAYAGTNIAVKNVVFRKVGENVNGSYTVEHIAKSSKLVMTAKWDPNKSTLNVVNNGATKTYSNKDYLSTQAINNPASQDDYIFTGWTLNSNPNGSFENGTYTFGPTAGVTDTLTAQWKYVPFNISGSGDSAKTNSAAIGFSGTLTPAPIDGITSRTTDASVALNNMNIGASIIETKDVSITNKIGASEYSSESKNVKFYPQTNILFETPDEPGTTTGTGKFTETGWKNVTSGKGNAGNSSSTIYGFSNNYANSTQYSNGSAMTITVDKNQSTWPMYIFEFTGTGFDIITKCDNRSGAMLIQIEKKVNDDYTWLGELKTDYPDYIDEAVNTHYYNGTLYQVPVYHKENLGYGTYRVSVAPYYSSLFDLTTSAPLQTANGETVDRPVDGDIIDLSDVPGSPFGKVKYSCFGEQAETDNNGLIIVEPGLVGGSGSYDVTIDAVRIYNPAGTGLSKTSGTDAQKEIAAQYINDNELNPTYSLSHEYIPTDTTDGKKVELLYESVDNNVQPYDYQHVAPDNEIYINAGKAFPFKVENYNENAVVHVSLRSPTGEPVIAVIGNNAVRYNINTATEMYYEIPGSAIGSDGTVTISAAAVESSDGFLSVCSLKTIGATPARMDSGSLLTSSYLQSLAPMLSLFGSTPAPEKTDLTFTVKFGNLTSKDITVSKDNLAVEIEDNNWVLKGTISADEIAKAFNSTEYNLDYKLAENKDINFAIGCKDGEWVTEDIEIAVEEIIPEAEKTEFTVKFGDKGLTTYNVAAESFKVEKINGVWTSTAELTAAKLAALLENAGIANNYKLASEDSVTAIAKYIERKWTAEDITVDVVEIIPEKEEMTFTVDFGEFGSTTITVSEDDIILEKVEGVWTAKINLTNAKLVELLEKAGLTDKCEITGENGITLIAKNVNGEWVEEKADVTVKEAENTNPGTDEPGTDEPGTDEPDEPADEPEEELTWIQKLLNFIKYVFSLCKEAVNKIILFIKSI